jgi:hypothetical protein
MTNDVSIVRCSRGGGVGGGTHMTIEYRPGSDFPFWVVREDGAIVCACPSEDAAKRVILGKKFEPYPNDPGFMVV